MFLDSAVTSSVYAFFTSPSFDNFICAEFRLDPEPVDSTLSVAMIAAL